MPDTLSHVTRARLNQQHRIHWQRVRLLMAGACALGVWGCAAVPVGTGVQMGGLAIQAPQRTLGWPVSFSPDATLLVAHGDVRDLGTLSPDGGALTFPTGASTSRFFTGTTLWDVGTAQPLRRFANATGNWVAWSPTGTHVGWMADSFATDLRVYESAQATEVHSATGVDAACFGGKQYPLCYVQGRRITLVREWSAPIRNETHLLGSGAGKLRAISCAPDESSLWLAGYGETIRILDLSLRTVRTVRKPGRPRTGIGRLQHSPDSRWCVATEYHNPDARGELHLLDGKTSRLVKSVPAGTGQVLFVRWSPTGRTLLLLERERGMWGDRERLVVRAVPSLQVVRELRAPRAAASPHTNQGRGGPAGAAAPPSAGHRWAAATFDPSGRKIIGVQWDGSLWSFSIDP